MPISKRNQAIRQRRLRQQQEQKNQLFRRKRFCRFTVTHVDKIDYKDVDVLKGCIQDNARITPARLTGTKSHYQRQLKTAIKRARFLALLPFTDLHDFK